MKKKLIKWAIGLFVGVIVLLIFNQTTEIVVTLGHGSYIPKADEEQVIFPHFKGESHIYSYKYTIFKYDSDILSNMKRFSTFDKINSEERREKALEIRDRMNTEIKKLYQNDDDSSKYNRPVLMEQYKIPIEIGFYYDYIENTKNDAEQCLLVYNPDLQEIYEICRF